MLGNRHLPIGKPAIPDHPVFLLADNPDLDRPDWFCIIVHISTFDPDDMEMQIHDQDQVFLPLVVEDGPFMCFPEGLRLVHRFEGFPVADYPERDRGERSEAGQFDRSPAS